MKEQCVFANCFVVVALVGGVSKLVWAAGRASTGVAVAAWKNGGLVHKKEMGVVALLS
jgi:hypothetical protein